LTIRLPKVDAQRDERLVADNAKNMRTIGRQYDRDARLQRDPLRLAVEPGLASPRKHRQRLDIGVRVDPGGIAGRRGLDAGADRQSLAGVVADDRSIGGAADKINDRPLLFADHGDRVGTRIGHRLPPGAGARMSIARLWRPRGQDRVVAKV